MQKASPLAKKEKLAGRYYACNWDRNAMKNHYLMVQIADMIKQLYEWFYLKKNEMAVEIGPMNVDNILLF